MAKAAYCSQCGQNVYLTADGRCPQGHAPEALTNHYDVADSPPAPTARAAAPKKKGLLIGVVVGLLLVCGLCGVVSIIGSAATKSGTGGSTSTAETQQAKPAAEPVAETSAPKPTPAPAPNPAPAPAADKKAAPAVVMGKPFTVGDAEIVIKSVDAVGKVGNEYVNKSGEYRVVALSIKNVSKKQFTTDSSNFKLIGSDSAEYSTDSDTLMYLDTKDSLFLAAINPGVTKDGKIIFAVPASAKITSVRVMGGLFDDPVDCQIK